MNATGTSRRQFLQATGGSLGLAWLAASWPQVVAAAAHGHDMAASADTIDRTKFLFLSPSQARDVDAIASQIVPSGATPGAHEAGSVHFIDRMHAGHWQQYGKEFLEGLTDFQATAPGTTRAPPSSRTCRSTSKPPTCGTWRRLRSSRA